MDKYSWPDPQSQVAFPISKSGYPLIFGAAFVTAVFALTGLTAMALTGIFITLAICLFFRDPDRVIPNEADAVVSPADGKVILAGIVDKNRFIEGPHLKISIFMSVFNVHVNRIPFEGTVTKVNYFPGKFFSANLDKASESNEHNAVFVETESKKTMCTVQIAGLIARRIICKIQRGDNVARGNRFGIICFGSRLDPHPLFQ